MKKQATKEVIERVAAELFWKFGFEKTSMDDIASQAHKAKRSIYNHFSSKEELFCSLAHTELEQIRQRLAEVMADDSQPVLPRLRQYLLLRMELVAQSSALQVAIKDKMLTSGDYRFERLQQIMSEFTGWEHACFKKVWCANPTPCDADILDQQAVAVADMLQVTLHGLSHIFFAEEKYARYKSSYEMLIDLIINSVFTQFVAHIEKSDGQTSNTSILK